ncbi:MAG: hypothetical protein GOVbin4162_123 [Prokaryotic dsDNA virus sp.]|nr:MAG: hypothetical protein GOVbin4162_123 [Prokaryotic dsDNA virus sp.]|tara:strand:- start:1700 stop:2056 length:357 start_codon:yes stop_codon:yes gene_type:complete
MKITLTSDLGDGYVDSIEIQDATLAEVLALTDAFFNNEKRNKEELINIPNQKAQSHSLVDWSGAPDWAKYYGETHYGSKVWYDDEKYSYGSDCAMRYFEEGYTYNSPSQFTEIASRGS